MLQVAMFVMVDGTRRGDLFVKPVLVGRDAMPESIPDDGETVTLGTRAFAELQLMAAREGIVVADVLRGCRIKAEPELAAARASRRRGRGEDPASAHGPDPAPVAPAYFDAPRELLEWWS